MKLFAARALAAIAFTFAVIASRGAAHAAVTGTWRISTERVGHRLHVRYAPAGGHDTDSDSWTIDPAALGIASALKSRGRRTMFSIDRDAGDFVFDGWFGEGRAAGSYTFSPNRPFFDALGRLGYDIDGTSRQIGYAMLDVTLPYAKKLNARVNGLTASNIIALKAMGVDRAYLDDIAGAGYSHLSANQYLSLKALHVDGAYIRYLEGHGFTKLSVAQILSMKATGV